MAPGMAWDGAEWGTGVEKVEGADCLLLCPWAACLLGLQRCSQWIMLAVALFLLGFII